MSDPDQTGDYWYLAQLKPGGFARASDNLARQSFTSFMPFRHVTRRRSGRLVTGREALFPGYLFVRIPPDRDDWRAVNSTYGVSRLVSLSGERPTPVPQGIMAELLARTDADGYLAEAGELRPGDEVRVVDGPFAASVARIVEVSARDRVFALIEMMGRTVRAELDPRDVEQL